MFGNITNLAHHRSIVGAIGFFLVYTVVLIGLSTFLGHYLVSLGVIDGVVGGFFEGGEIHTMIGAGWVLVLSSMMLQSKKLTNDIMAVVLSVIGVYLAYTVDVMLGMVVVSFISTLGK